MFFGSQVVKSVRWCCQAFDSRMWAVEEIEKLLQRPEDLKRLDTLLEEYTAKNHVRFAWPP